MRRYKVVRAVIEQASITSMTYEFSFYAPGLVTVQIAAGISATIDEPEVGGNLKITTDGSTGARNPSHVLAWQWSSYANAGAVGTYESWHGSSTDARVSVTVVLFLPGVNLFRRGNGRTLALNAPTAANRPLVRPIRSAVRSSHRDEHLEAHADQRRCASLLRRSLGARAYRSGVGRLDKACGQSRMENGVA